MDADLDVINKALIHIGSTAKIADIENDDADEAVAVKSVYEDALGEFFRAVNWNFAKAYATLDLLDYVPTDQWSFAYSLPTNCFFPRRIVTGTLADSEKSRIPFEIVHGTAGTILLTEQADPVLEYTILVEDSVRWPADFKRAFALKLAVLIAPAVGKGDPKMVTERVTRQFTKAYRQAIARNRQEGVRRGRPDSPMIEERS